MRQELSERFLQLVQDARARVREVNALELAAGPSSDSRPLHIVDIRDESAWASGHIAGAERIGRELLERDMRDRIELQNSHIVICSGSGLRSILVADVLTRMGFTRVASLAGGFNAWRAAGLPVVVDTTSER
ncbi:MAG: sulfurtransferase [Candidatus Wallbacteria bacterium]|nr:sulfurtransferase [Candidatus Wallbacteria bacterium]